MSIFLNPKTSKDDWLKQYATPTSKPSWIDRPEGCYPICLVVNGIFTTGIIIDTPEEYQFWIRPDGKIKYWFYASIEDLKQASAFPKEVL